MRILHIVHQYHPEHTGGTELYTRQLATRQADLGHDVAVITPAAESSIVVEDGVTVHRVGIGKPSRTTTFLNTLRQPKLLNALRAILPTVDLVHIQHLMGWPLGIVDVIRAQDRPYIITLHDYWFPCANAQLYTNYDQTVCGGADERWHNCGRCVLARGGLGDRPGLAHAVAPLMRRRMERLRPVLEGAAAVIAPTEFVKDIYHENGFDVEMRVVRHGIEFPAPPLNPPRRGGDSGSPSLRGGLGGGFHAVYVGSIAEQKGIHVLIDAFNRLSEERFKLTIAGGLGAFPEYVARLEGMIENPSIELIGRIPHEQVGALFSAADVAVLPTLWYEVSPLTIDEIFAVKTPIVASNIGAMTEKIRDGIDGVLFRVGDAAALADTITYLADNQDVLVGMREAILPVNRIEAHVAAVMDVYHAAAI